VAKNAGDSKKLNTKSSASRFAVDAIFVYGLVSMGVDQIVRPSICLGQSHSLHFDQRFFLNSPILRNSIASRLPRSHKIGKIAVARGLSAAPRQLSL
jgi:hypothetical protein